MSKTNFVLQVDTAKLARAMDGLPPADRQFVAETITFLGSPVLDTESVSVAKEAGLMAMRIERMSDADRNVVKGLISRVMAKAKDRAKKKTGNTK